MRLVRAVRQGGDAGSLWPQGVTSIDDIPWDLVEAIAQAHTILDWYANMPEEDIPPMHLWPFAEELHEWFEIHKAHKRSQAEIDAIPADERPANGYWDNSSDPFLRQLKER